MAGGVHVQDLPRWASKAPVVVVAGGVHVQGLPRWASNIP